VTARVHSVAVSVTKDSVISGNKSSSFLQIILIAFDNRIGQCYIDGRLLLTREEDVCAGECSVGCHVDVVERSSRSSLTGIVLWLHVFYVCSFSLKS
jgi:hypothetical protein